MTVLQLELLEYDEYIFLTDTVEEKQAQAKKQMMVAASFTAWQIICSNGGKMSWRRHLEVVGLSEYEKLSKEEVAETAATTVRILSKLGKIKT